MIQDQFLLELSSTIKHYDHFFRKSGIYTLYPELCEEISDYEERLLNSKKLPWLSSNHVYKGLYHTNIESDQYEIVWNIPHNLNGEIITINMDNPIIYHDLKSLGSETLLRKSLRPGNDKPIILVNNHTIGRLVIVDGNHRFELAKRAGQKYISAIVLKPEEHLKLMVTDQMRNAYIIHHNLISLSRLIHSTLIQKWIFECSHSLELGTFYNFKKKIDFRFSKNIRISK